MIIIAALVGAAGLRRAGGARALGTVNIPMRHLEDPLRLDHVSGDILDARLPQPGAGKRASECLQVVSDEVDIVFARHNRREALALRRQGRDPRRDRSRRQASYSARRVPTLSIEPGEICVLMGLSGSGKSTILRAVNGLNKVARGKVLVQSRRSGRSTSRVAAPTNCA